MKSFWFRSILLAPDPDPGAGGGGDPKPDAGGTPPASPPAVKKTPIKTPAEIALEKKLSAAEDRIDSLEGALAEVNKSLEGLNIGGPVKIKPGPVPAAGKGGNTPPPNVPETPPSFAQQVERDIWGQG